MSPDDPDYYSILQISPNAKPAEIKKAYYKLAKIWHPDKNGSVETEEKFKEIQKAYETLSDPSKRVLYDEKRIRSQSAFRNFTSKNHSNFNFNARGGFNSGFKKETNNANRYSFDFNDFGFNRFGNRSSYFTNPNDNFAKSFFDHHKFFDDAFSQFDSFMDYIRLRFGSMTFGVFGDPFFFNGAFDTRRNLNRRNLFDNGRRTRSFNTSSSFYKPTRDTFSEFSRYKPAHNKRSSWFHLCKFCGKIACTLSEVINHEKLCLDNPANKTRIDESFFAKKPNMQYSANGSNDYYGFNQKEKPNKKSHVAQVRIKLVNPEKYTCRFDEPLRSTLHIVVT